MGNFTTIAARLNGVREYYGCQNKSFHDAGLKERSADMNLHVAGCVHRNILVFLVFRRACVATESRHPNDSDQGELLSALATLLQQSGTCHCDRHCCAGTCCSSNSQAHACTRYELMKIWAPQRCCHSLELYLDVQQWRGGGICCQSHGRRV